LRGGGGFSYGIVTELIFEAFDLPDDALVSMSHFLTMASLIAVQLTFFSVGECDCS